MKEDLFYDARKGLGLVPKEKPYEQLMKDFKELEEKVKKLEIKHNLLWQRIVDCEKDIERHTIGPIGCGPL